MTAPKPSQIEKLRASRFRVAVLAQRLGERELEARLLRARLEAEARARGETQTAAEKAAKMHPDYLAHERETLTVAFARDQEVAMAEALRILLGLHDGTEGEP